MHIADSQLFKTFARPVLRDSYEANAASSAPKPGIMDSIVQYLMGRSKLEVSQVKIEDATEDSYVISIESNVSGTGPVSSTISPMEIDLTFNGTSMGKVKLPQMVTSFWGTKVSVPAQRVKIADMTTYRAFVHSTIVNDDMSFRLENGKCTINSLGLTANCTYSTEVALKGMGGPRMTLANLDREGDEITVTSTVYNPSPTEIDNGVSRFELRNTNGETMAELRGVLKIVRGTFDFTLQGKLKPSAVLLSNKMRLVAVGVEDKTWCNETIQSIQATVDVDPKFSKLLQARNG